MVEVSREPLAAAAPRGVRLRAEEAGDRPGPSNRGSWPTSQRDLSVSLGGRMRPAEPVGVALLTVYGKLTRVSQRW